MRSGKVLVISAIIALVFMVSVPCGADPINDEGISSFKKGDYDRALNLFSGAIDLRPDDEQGYLNRGVVFMTKGQYDLAMMDFNKAISLNSSSSEAYTNRATVFVAQNQLKQAFNDASTAIQLNQYNPRAYYTRAVAAFLSDSMDTVWADLMNSQRLGYIPATQLLAIYRSKVQR
jgi:tetratricopeptide (TPR) repeat protein